MHKNKSKPKSKSKNKSKSGSTKNNEKQTQSKQNHCRVCRFEIKGPQSSMMVCEVCKVKVHSSCYNNQHNPKKPFRCDLCTSRKNQAVYCAICQQNDRQPLRKVVSVGSEQKFVHVECAMLVSPLVIEIQSYSKMALHWVNSPDKKEKNKVPCSVCGKTSQGPYVSCVQCDKNGHFQCLIVFLGDNSFYYMVSRWLQKCEKHDFLLHYITSKKRTALKPPLVSLPPKFKEGQLMICPEHEDNYPFCYCNNQQQTINKVYDDYQCNICDRWVHQTCSGLPPHSNEDLLCQGCKNNDIFKKQLKLNQLLDEISRLEKPNQPFDEIDIRLLNAFPYKYSTVLQKKIQQNQKPIQLYFAKREILKILNQPNINDKKKKLTQLLLFITYGQDWKQNEIQINKNSEKASSIKAEILRFNNVKFEKDVQNRLISLYGGGQKIMSKQMEQFKQCLKNFIRQWKTKSGSTTKNSCIQLSYCVKQLQSKFLEAFPTNQFPQILQSISHNTDPILPILLKKTISIELLSATLERYIRIKNVQKRSNQIIESEYIKLLKEPQGIMWSETQIQAWRCVAKVFKDFLDSMEVVYNSFRKEEKYIAFEQKLRTNNHLGVLEKLEKQALDQGVCTIGQDGIFMRIRMQTMQQNIIKKKILRMCSRKQQSFSQQNFRDIIRIQEYLRENKKLFTSSEFAIIKSYLSKLQFLQYILRKGQPLQQYGVSQNQSFNNNNNNNKYGTVFMKFFNILDFWDDRVLTNQLIISEMYNKFVRNQVKFENQFVNQRLKALVMHICSKIANNMSQGRKISSFLLKRIVKVLIFFDVEKEFPAFCDLFDKYKKWGNIFNGQQLPIKISNYLQKPEKSTALLKQIETKISTFSQIQNLNLQSQLTKLCMLRQWCKLSQKMGILSKSKATINAIQNLKSLLQKSHYPLNTLSKKINQLDIQGKNLNKEVIKFLQKPKYQQYVGFFDEIKFISNKLLISQGYAIKAMLQKCNLDVYVENQELENQIKEFQMLPSKLEGVGRGYSEMQGLRRKLIQSCFRGEDINEYQGFLRKIYKMRCERFQPPVCKQQYYQLLTIGGATALALQSQTCELSRVYNMLQKSQQQLQKPVRQRNFSNLLPISQKLHKQIKQALKIDPTQLNKYQKQRLNNLKLREQYLNLRTRKTQIQRYKQLQVDLNSTIFNNRDILIQIQGFKNQLMVLVRRIEEVLPYSMYYGFGGHTMNGFGMQYANMNQNIFRRGKELLDMYNGLKIKSNVLDKFEADLRSYIKSQNFRQERTIEPENYRQYTQHISRMSDLTFRIPQILATRTDQFFIAFKSFMQNQQKSILLLNTLIEQGLQLRKLGSEKRNTIFEMVIELYQKKKQYQRKIQVQDDQDDDDDDEEEDDGVDQNGKLKRRRPEDIDSDSDSEGEDDQEGNEDDDGDSEDDDDDEDMDMGISDEDDDDQQDGSPSNQPNGGQNNQIVLDSD